jgi:hypothetical protein
MRDTGCFPVDLTDAVANSCSRSASGYVAARRFRRHISLLLFDFSLVLDMGMSIQRSVDGSRHSRSLLLSLALSPVYPVNTILIETFLFPFLCVIRRWHVAFQDPLNVGYISLGRMISICFPVRYSDRGPSSTSLGGKSDHFLHAPEITVAKCSPASMRCLQGKILGKTLTYP